MLVSGLIGFSQVIVNRSGASNTVSDARLQAQYNLFTPRYTDTTAANVQKGVDSCGAIIYTRTPQAKWTRFCNPKRWVRDIDAESISSFIDSSGNNISVLDSNTFMICNGAGVCDTFHSSINFTTIQFITDSSVEVCHADTITNSVVSICDTINVGVQPNPYIFQNWLNRNGNIVEFGSPTYQGNGYFLGHNTYVNTGQSTLMYFDNWGIYSHGYLFRKPAGFGFQNGTGLASFLHENGNPGTGGDDATNTIPLNIDWTGTDYSDEFPGYFGTATQGYILGTNGGGAGSYGWNLADRDKPTTGLVFHTDNNGKGVTIYGAAANTAIGNTFKIVEGGTGLQNYAIADFYTNKNLRFYGYDSLTRNDGTLTKVLGTDEFGNVLLGRSAGSSVTIVNDTTLIICSNGDNLCDTFYVSAGLTAITADNGLTANTSSNVQLGGTLLQNTTVNTAGFTTTWTGANTGTTFSIINSSSGGALFASSTSNTAVSGIATSGKGGNFQSTDGNGIETTTASATSAAGSFVLLPSSTNTVRSIIDVARLTTGTPSSGIGGSIDFDISSDGGGGRLSNQLISKWTTVADASRTSQFIITGVNSAVAADIAYFNGNGYVLIPGTGNPTYTLESRTNSNTAILGTAASSGNGVVGQSIDGYGVNGNSSTSYGVYGNTNSSIAVFGWSLSNGTAGEFDAQTTGTSDVTDVLVVKRMTSNTAANFIGGAIRFNTETDNGTTSQMSNQIISRWTDATNATRTSQFKVNGVLSGTTVDVLTLNANGSMQLRPITAIEASAITPVEGMIVIVNTTDATFTSTGFWGYSAGAWAKF